MEEDVFARALRYLRECRLKQLGLEELGYVVEFTVTKKEEDERNTAAS